MICINNWIYNLEKVFSLFSRKDRQKALNSTQRLEEFVYNDNHIEGPTHQETEEEQRKVDELYYLHLTRYTEFKDLLKSAESYSQSPTKMADWLLEKRGYHGVNVKGISNPLTFAAALNSGYEDNIRGMFKHEKDFLAEKIKESEKYLSIWSKKN